MNSTSSSGALSSVRGRVGGRKKRFGTTFSAALDGGFFTDGCHIEKKAGGRAGSLIGRTRLRTPKVSVTTSESTRVTDPTGSVSGTTNQSFPSLLAACIIITVCRRGETA